MPTENLIQGHKKYKNNFLEDEQHFLELAVKGQKPKALWIGCSDSRVNPELIMGAKPGELFVLRNIANIVPPQQTGDSCTSSVLEYAIFELQIEHIVICGHTDCGGMKALLKDSMSLKESSISTWLENARSAKNRMLSKNVKDELASSELIKENILLQAEHLLSFDYIKERFHSGKVNIHEWLYDLHTGTILSYNPEEKSWIEFTE